jgi:hypothetical protein
MTEARHCITTVCKSLLYLILTKPLKGCWLTGSFAICLESPQPVREIFRFFRYWDFFLENKVSPLVKAIYVRL